MSRGWNGRWRFIREWGRRFWIFSISWMGRGRRMWIEATSRWRRRWGWRWNGTPTSGGRLRGADFDAAVSEHAVDFDGGCGGEIHAARSARGEGEGVFGGGV